MGDAVPVYRCLYRALLKAVQYASPARFTVRDQLRVAFREPGASLDAEATKRTLWFLQAAAKERGLEHKILKNLVKVRQKREARATAWRQVLAKSSRKKDEKYDENAAFQHYNMTIAMLNQSMGLCLR